MRWSHGFHVACEVSFQDGEGDVSVHLICEAICQCEKSAGECSWLVFGDIDVWDSWCWRCCDGGVWISENERMKIMSMKKIAQTLGRNYSEANPQKLHCFFRNNYTVFSETILRVFAFSFGCEKKGLIYLGCLCSGMIVGFLVWGFKLFNRVFKFWCIFGINIINVLFRLFRFWCQILRLRVTGSMFWFFNIPPFS